MNEQPKPRRFLHILGHAPLMMITEIPPEFNLSALVHAVKADQHYFDGQRVFVPYHAIQAILLAEEAPLSPPTGYEATDSNNVVAFPGKPAA